MKVKAKWAVKVNGVWRKAGDEFEVDTTAGLLGSVEVIEKESKPARAKAAPVEEPEVVAEPEPAAEPEAVAEPKPKTAARTRKKTTGK